MRKFKDTFDYVILGAGITGLTISREILSRNRDAEILLIEKENEIGLHGTGRNSGVLHSGIYYPTKSLKAKFCSEGSKLMKDYCYEKGLPVLNCGKVILPTSNDEINQIHTLLDRGRKNGANVFKVNSEELQEIEPEANNSLSIALYSPDTSVVDPKKVMHSIFNELVNSKSISVLFSDFVVFSDPEKSLIITNKGFNFTYGHLINTTGQYADVTSKSFGIGNEYTIIPFKGVYYGLSEKSNIKLNGLVYPVPDLNVPFLGIHSVKLVNEDIYFGPTAFPAFGRENYNGLQGISLKEASTISFYLLKQYFKNNQGFRNYTHQESLKFLKKNFVKSIKKLIPSIDYDDLVQSNKVGIRAQLYNTTKNQLEMDFVVKTTSNTTHVLNAVSPAFTSSLSFSKYILDLEK